MNSWHRRVHQRFPLQALPDASAPWNFLRSQKDPVSFHLPLHFFHLFFFFFLPQSKKDLIESVLSVKQQTASSLIVQSKSNVLLLYSHVHPLPATM